MVGGWSVGSAAIAENPGARIAVVIERIMSVRFMGHLLEIGDMRGGGEESTAAPGDGTSVTRTGPSA
jgi:hypothetical protein